MLEDTVRSVLAAAAPDGCAIEILVVDNASTDDTTERMRPFADGGTIRLVREDKPGLSNARNTGLDHASGDWVFFLDDDVYVDVTFFESYANAIRQLPECRFWGGPVIPTFEGETAPWVDAVCRTHPWCFSAMRLSPPTRILTAQQTPYGANMCIQRDIASRYRFDTSLGYNHGSLVPGEETSYFKELRRRGFVGGWNAEGHVLHRLPADRARLGYLVRRAAGQGVSDARETKALGKSSRWVLREIPMTGLRLLRDSWRGTDHVIPHILDLSRNVSHAKTAVFG